jgi:hypothetical protein
MMTLSLTMPNAYAVSIIIMLSVITTLGIRIERHYAACRIFKTVMLSAVMMSVVAPSSQLRSYEENEVL